jgi:regulator of sigma E protease
VRRKIQEQHRENKMTIDAIRNFLFFILVLGSLVLVHELGHFLAALLARVRIKEFGLGLPPRLVQLTKWRETEITLNWLPLGGFVRPEGEFDPTVPDGLAACSPWRRLGVFAAGPIANLLLGLCLLATGFMVGWPDQVSVVDVFNDSPAEAAGLRPEDIILFAQGQPVHNTVELHDLIHANLGTSFSIAVLRGEERTTLTFIPRNKWPEGEGPAGFITTAGIIRYSPGKSIQRAFEQSIVLVNETISLTVQLASHQISQTEARISGPVGLKQISDQAINNAVNFGESFPVLYLGAWLSIALGLTNLLPLPALDGGRALFVGVELVLSKRINPQVEKWVHAIGMVALLCLFILLTINDVRNPLQ